MRSAFATPEPTIATALTQGRKYVRSDLSQHLLAGGKKRVLSIDGGGVRSAMSLAILIKIEAILRRRYGNNRAFRLSDYFDLVGGASSGAIIAALISASNFSMSDVRDAWFEIAQDVYVRRRSFLGDRTGSSFRGPRLRKLLDQTFGPATLGDDRLATGLAIVARRVDTDQTLIFNNHPDDPDFRSTDSFPVGFRQIPIAAALRACTACPEEFAPEMVELTNRPRRTRGVFIDASVTTHNNPALKLFMLCTSPDSGFNWHTGADHLHVISVGSGSLCQTLEPEEARNLQRRKPMRQALTSLLDDADHTGDQMMRLISSGDRDTAQCLYTRYQAPLREDKIRKELGLGLSAKQIAKVRTMTDPDGLQIAFEIGQAIADKIVVADDFAPEFDLPEPMATPASDKDLAGKQNVSINNANVALLDTPGLQAHSVRASASRY